MAAGFFESDEPEPDVRARLRVARARAEPELRVELFDSLDLDVESPLEPSRSRSLPFESLPAADRFDDAAVVGLVEARALEHDAGRRQDLRELAAAALVLGERRLGEGLEHLELLAALGAAVVVGRHRTCSGARR